MMQQIHQADHENQSRGGSHRIFVAVISHHNEIDIIHTLRPHKWHQVSPVIVPIVLSNIPSELLNQYCKSHNLTYLENDVERGFGANNNQVFHYACQCLGAAPEDYLFCINPDIRTEAKDICLLQELMEAHHISIAAPNLTNKAQELEDNIREYPTLTDIMLRFMLGSKRTTIKKDHIRGITPVDWASGAFLCFRISIYAKLKGFDERYYMYYEDADICRRGADLGAKTYFVPQVTAVHTASRASRSLFSRHLLWHFSSAVRFTQLNKR